MQQPIFDFNEWWHRPEVKHLLNWELSYLNSQLPRLYGNHLLQIGGSPLLLKQLKSLIGQQTYLQLQELSMGAEFESATSPPSCLTSLNELPLLPESVELIILPHVLEFCADPQRLLADLYQALKPEGYLIVLSFNQYGVGSFWKMQSWQRGLPWQPAAKWTKEQHWRQLQAVGFNPIQRHCLGFLPWLGMGSQPWLNGLERVASWLYPELGGVSILLAKKEVLSVLRPKPEWAQVPLMAALSEGSVRNNAHDR